MTTSEAFATARGEGRAALVGYLPAGFPDLDGAIESAHALAGAFEVARDLGRDGLVLVNLSGRGDKDMETAREWFGLGRQA